MNGPGDGSFVWPPRDGAGATAPVPPPDPPSNAERAPVRPSLLSLLERAWLSPTRWPFARRVAMTGWTPDEASAYCARCGQAVGAYEEDEFGCAACAGSRPPWSRVVRLGAYAEPVADWVQEVKFEHAWRLGEAMGRLLGERLLEAGFEGRSGVIVPVPTTWRRRMARGTDHTLVVARGVARATGGTVCRALGRRHRLSQRSVTPSARQRNVSGVFLAREGALRRVGARDLVVVDDVLTSGATMKAVCRCLSAGLRDRGGECGTIWSAVLAVTPPASGPGSAGETGVARRERGGADEGGGG